MLKKTKLILASLILSLSCSQSQAGLVGYSLDHPVKTARAVIWAAGITVAAGVVAKAAYLAYHPNEVQSYFKKNPSQIEPISQQVLNKLRNPANRDEYNYYKKLAEQMGLRNIPPYAPIKTNIPTTLVNPITNQDPKGSVLVNPINPDHPEINLDPRDPRTHYDFSKDLPNHTTTPIQEPNWQDNIIEKNANNVRELEKNMRNDGYGDKPYWYSPHHIVAWDDPRASVPRKILDDVGIQINDSVNGVYLPQREKNRLNGDNSTRHPLIHTDLYYTEIENRLIPLKGNRQAIEKELKNIASEIKNNKFPY